MIGWEDGYEIVAVYEAIPADIDALSLVVPLHVTQRPRVNGKRP